MNYIITRNRKFFESLGNYSYCNLEDMVLTNTLAIDTETTGLDIYMKDGEFYGADIFCVQIGTGDNNYIIDCQAHNNGYHPSVLKKYIEGRTLVFHNATFDLRFLYKHGIFPKKVFDTMIASQIYYNGGRDAVYTHNFGAVMLRELDVYYEKSEQKTIAYTQLKTKKAIEYSFNDVDRLLELHSVLFKKLYAEDSLKVYKLNCNFTRALAYIELCGLPVNEKLWKDKIEDDKKNFTKTEKQITEYIYHNLYKYADRQLDMFDSSKKITVSLTSPKQMIPVFKDLGINVVNSQGKESIKEDVLRKTKHEFVDLWLKYQGLQQRLSTFGENVLSQVINGRLYSHFKVMVDTCRVAHGKNGKINFLNFPHDKITRSCFEAKEGNVMIGADYAGQENVSGASHHHDAVMVSVVNDGKDLHCALARELFPELKDLSDDEIMDKHSDKRQESKSPRFLMSYGGGANTMSANLGIPLQRAEEIESLYKKLHSGIYSWGDKMLKQSMEDGYISSGFGWKLWLPKYQMFCELKEIVESKNKKYWDSYRKGKKEYQSYKKDNDYEIKDYYSFELYKEDKDTMKSFFSLKGLYMRLCLNNPIQTISAFQAKASIIRLFETILERGDFGKALICNIPYDEILMEVVEESKDFYLQTIETCMVEEGNKWLVSDIVKLKADAKAGDSWGNVH